MNPKPEKSHFCGMCRDGTDTSGEAMTTTDIRVTDFGATR